MGRILVVDDDELVRISVANLLQALGFTTSEASDGLEAIRLYQSRHGEFSLVLMDIVMPNLDGIDASKEIKTHDPAVKVVLMSGYSDRPVVEAEADAFLSKPFTSRELLQTVEKVLLGEAPKFSQAVGH